MQYVYSKSTKLKYKIELCTKSKYKKNVTSNCSLHNSGRSTGYVAFLNLLYEGI